MGKKTLPVEIVIWCIMIAVLLMAVTVIGLGVVCLVHLLGVTVLEPTFQHIVQRDLRPIDVFLIAFTGGGNLALGLWIGRSVRKAYAFIERKWEEI